MTMLHARGSVLPQRLAEQLTWCVERPDRAWTLPAACYVDPAVYDVELDAIFRSGWVSVGRVDRWPQIGDFSAMDLAGVPIVITRAEDGRLRAHANSCLHRSAQIVTGSGSCRRMRCPFHAWTYSLDGRLVGAPQMHRTEGFDPEEFHLVEFWLAERAGFVFVSLEAEPPAIDDWLGDFEAHHAPWPIADLVMSRRREFTVDCNWKAFIEVFNEYYHLPFVHPDSIDETYLEPDEPDVVTGAHATHFGTTIGTGGLLTESHEHALPPMPGLPEREARGVRYSWIFPNVAMALGADAMWGYEIYPDGPNRCRGAQFVTFPRSTMERDDFVATVALYYERFDVALDEDIPMLVQQQAGMSSPFTKQGRFSYLEPSVASFASWYAQRLLAC